MGDEPAVSPSLLRPLDNLPQCYDRAFGLGVSELLGEPLSTKRLHLSELRNTLDTVCIQLRKEGIGAEISHAPVVLYEHEMMMWKSGVLGFEPPEALFRAVLMTVGMYFSLRGGQENYDLKVDQFKRDPAVGYSKETQNAL